MLSFTWLLQLELHRYATGTQSRVVTAMTLLKSHLFRCGGCSFADLGWDAWLDSPLLLGLLGLKTWRGWTTFLCH